MSVVPFDVYKEATYTINYFMKYIKQTHGINLDNINISEFIEFYQKKQTFHTTQDTFIHICSFLPLSDVVTFSTLCRNFMEYYPYVWDAVRQQWFPASIAKNLDYKDIRTALSLEHYYHGLIDHNVKDDDWVRINDAEKNMEKYSNLMKAAIENPNGDAKAHQYFHEYKCYEDDRFKAIAHTSKEMLSFLKEYQFNSLTNICNIQYLTLKPEINCEVYGLDPETDKHMARNKRGWMTGEYTTRVEYNYISSEDDNPEDFVYGNDPISSEQYRYRIRPNYC
jgi:hypothetical protein